jgi:hypothetical protein
MLFKIHFEEFFTAKNRFFFLECQCFAFLSFENHSFFTWNQKFVSFRSGFVFFLDIFDRNSFYFPFDHSDLRIKLNVSFRYRNKLKIRSQKRIGFMHIDITSLVA